jgi:hypothetical protein
MRVGTWLRDHYPKAALVDAHFAVGMTFGVEGEDTARTDHNMVDIGTSIADLNGMTDVPFVGKLGQFADNLLLALGADASGSFVGLHARHTSYEVPDWCMSIDLVPLGPCAGPGPVLGEVIAR